MAVQVHTLTETAGALTRENLQLRRQIGASQERVLEAGALQADADEADGTTWSHDRTGGKSAAGGLPRGGTAPAAAGAEGGDEQSMRLELAMTNAEADQLRVDLESRTAAMMIWYTRATGNEVGRDDCAVEAVVQAALSSAAQSNMTQRNEADNTNISAVDSRKRWETPRQQLQHGQHQLSPQPQHQQQRDNVQQQPRVQHSQLPHHSAAATRQHAAGVSSSAAQQPAKGSTGDVEAASSQQFRNDGFTGHSSSGTQALLATGLQQNLPSHRPFDAGSASGRESTARETGRAEVESKWAAMRESVDADEEEFVPRDDHAVTASDASWLQPPPTMDDEGGPVQASTSQACSSGDDQHTVAPNHARCQASTWRHAAPAPGPGEQLVGIMVSIIAAEEQQNSDSLRQVVRSAGVVALDTNADLYTARLAISARMKALEAAVQSLSPAEAATVLALGHQWVFVAHGAPIGLKAERRWRVAAAMQQPDRVLHGTNCDQPWLLLRPKAAVAKAPSDCSSNSGAARSASFASMFGVGHKSDSALATRPLEAKARTVSVTLSPDHDSHMQSLDGSIQGIHGRRRSLSAAGTILGEVVLPGPATGVTLMVCRTAITQQLPEAPIDFVFLRGGAPVSRKQEGRWNVVVAPDDPQLVSIRASRAHRKSNGVNSPLRQSFDQ
eukprot:SAG31_NODE_2077_length_6501_cov_2.482037_2_plen_670_part_00